MHQRNVLLRRTGTLKPLCLALTMLIVAGCYIPMARPCEELVEHLCECANDETCLEARGRYENADAHLKSECQDLLDEAEEEADERCAAESGGDSGGGS